MGQPRPSQEWTDDVWRGDETGRLVMVMCLAWTSGVFCRFVFKSLSFHVTSFALEFWVDFRAKL